MKPWTSMTDISCTKVIIIIFFSQLLLFIFFFLNFFLGRLPAGLPSGSGSREFAGKCKRSSVPSVYQLLVGLAAFDLPSCRGEEASSAPTPPCTPSVRPPPQHQFILWLREWDYGSSERYRKFLIFVVVYYFVSKNENHRPLSSNQQVELDKNCWQDGWIVSFSEFS